MKPYDKAHAALLATRERIAKRQPRTARGQEMKRQITLLTVMKRNAERVREWPTRKEAKWATRKSY